MAHPEPSPPATTETHHSERAQEAPEEKFTVEQERELVKIRKLTLDAEQALRLRKPKRPSAEQVAALATLKSTGIITDIISESDQLQLILELRRAAKNLIEGRKNTAGFTLLHRFLMSPRRPR